MSVTSSPADIEAADLAVLPGVGSAASAMDGLRERGLDEALQRRVRAGGSTLGICLGLQLALEESEEDGGVAGLGLLPGRAVRLARRAASRASAGRRWSPTARRTTSRIRTRPRRPRRPRARRGRRRVAEAGSFLGVQFHPEKSGAAGARLLERCLSRA